MCRGFFASLVEFRASLSHDDQIRYFGWVLLIVWTLSIIYMTRDFWFPSAFGLPPLSDRVRGPLVRTERRSQKRNISRKGLELLDIQRLQANKAFSNVSMKYIN